MANFVNVTGKNHLQLTALAYLRIIHRRKFVYIAHSWGQDTCSLQVVGYNNEFLWISAFTVMYNLFPLWLLERNQDKTLRCDWTFGGEYIHIYYVNTSCILKSISEETSRYLFCRCASGTDVRYQQQNLTATPAAFFYIPHYVLTYLPHYLLRYLLHYLLHYLPHYLPTALPTTLSTAQHTTLPTALPHYLPPYVPTYLPSYLPCYLSHYLLTAPTALIIIIIIQYLYSAYFS